MSLLKEKSETHTFFKEEVTTKDSKSTKVSDGVTLPILFYQSLLVSYRGIEINAKARGRKDARHSIDSLRFCTLAALRYFLLHERENTSRFLIFVFLRALRGDTYATQISTSPFFHFVSFVFFVVPIMIFNHEGHEDHEG